MRQNERESAHERWNLKRSWSNDSFLDRGTKYHARHPIGLAHRRHSVSPLGPIRHAGQEDAYLAVQTNVAGTVNYVRQSEIEAFADVSASAFILILPLTQLLTI
jgi:hypothetical protein